MKMPVPHRISRIIVPLFALISVIGHISAIAQQSTSIGTTILKSNAVLYLYSEGKNQGLIVPVVSDKNRVSTPDEGMIVYDELDHKLYYRNNLGWVELSAPETSSGTPGGGGGSGTLTMGGDVSGASNATTIQRIQGKTISASSPANGQILKYNASTQTWELSVDAGTSYAAGTGITINAGNQISIANGGVTDTQLSKASIPLSGFGAPSASIDLGNQRITNLATPTAGTDATTKAYTDAGDATKLNANILNAGGDLLFHNGTAPARLGRGTNGQALVSTGATIQWSNLPSSFANPMTTTGDIIVGAASGTAMRVPGAAGFLKSTGPSAPAWSSVNLASTDVTGSLPLTNGGTGATTAGTARTNLGLGTLATLNSADLTTNVANTLPLANGGTGATTAGAARTNLGLGTLATLNSADLTTNVTNTLPLANGGTGATTAGAARTNLGLGTLATLNSADLTTNVTNTLPLANGGTGATTATAARTNLGLGTVATLNSVTSTEITNGTIVNADVNASAAIAGTKIDPDFGSQFVTTTGNARIGSVLGYNGASQDYSTGINGSGVFKISNSLTLGTNDAMEITPSGTTAVTKFFCGARGQEGVHVLSTDSWGTSLHISNGSSTSTGAGYSLTVTGASGPTGRADDFALIASILPAFTIGYNSTIGAYQGNFPMGYLGVGRDNTSHPFEVEGNAGKTSGPNWSTVSDRRLKKDISPFSDGLNVITKINPIWFKYSGNGGLKASKDFEVGIIAQEMKEIAPYTVNSFKAKYDESSTQEEEFYDFNFSALNFALINSVKELDNRVKTLEQENASLKQQLQDSTQQHPPDDTSLQLKAELETQKHRTDQLEAEMKELKKLLYMEAKKSEEKKE